MAIEPQNPPASRERLTLDLSPQVSLLLDHINAITGAPRSQIALAAIVDALPAMVERADQLKKRAGELSQAKGGKK